MKTRFVLDSEEKHHDELFIHVTSVNFEEFIKFSFALFNYYIIIIIISNCHFIDIVFFLKKTVRS